MRLIWTVPLSLVLAALLAIATGYLVIPDRYNPWAPLRLADRPNFLTGYKLGRLADDPAQCHAFLERAGIRFAPVADRVNATGCYFRNAVQIAGSGIDYGSAFTLSCRMAAGLALLERHALQPAAQAAFGQPITRIEHFGSYACRNVYNRDAGRLSQHATANAFDVAGFRLRDGRRVTVAGDWGGEGAGSDFLRQVHGDACGIFRTVLGPDYNAAHRDHFHLDMGDFSICR